MIAGKLTRRVEFLKRYGYGWTVVTTVWAGIAPPKPGGVRKGGVMDPQNDEVTIRYSEEVRPGYLMRDTSTDEWYRIEAIQVQNKRWNQTVLGARPIEGQDGSYYPVGDTSRYCRVMQVQANEWQGDDAVVNEMQYWLDLFVPDLNRPYAQAKDRIDINGLLYTVISSVSGGDDWVTCRVLCEAPMASGAQNAYMLIRNGYALVRNGYALRVD